MDPKKILKKNPDTCRNCLNRIYGLNLTPDDIRYSRHSYQCAVCGNMHQIPMKFNISGKMKVLISIDKQGEEDFDEQW